MKKDPADEILFYTFDGGVATIAFIGMDKQNPGD
jgi:hypothetical protein